MLGEVRNALLLQRVENGAAALTASQAFQMATENGAKMLNFGKVGKIKKGGLPICPHDINSSPIPALYLIRWQLSSSVVATMQPTRLSTGKCRRQRRFGWF